MIKTVHRILGFYNVLEKDNNYQWAKWSRYRRRFSKKSSDAFFIGVLLDQGQNAERAWSGGQHLVENYFKNKKNFWKSVSKTHYMTIKKICQKGYNGTSYASNYAFNKFPNWLNNASIKMVNEYSGDPRNIWNVSTDNVKNIYDRFIDFDGIGDALAKMAQFILVRNYGVAGGLKNRANMSVKPDTLVRRVMFRSGISSSETVTESIEVIENLSLPSPADFDAAAWIIGREFCNKSDPKCSDCPILKVCDYGKIN